MQTILCPSIMCADYNQLRDEVIALDKAGCDIFHCDVMDGIFVPNITMGVMDVKVVRSNTDKIVDVHLMCERPADKIDLFINCGVDLFYIHPETDNNSIETLKLIKAKNKLAGIVISPDIEVDRFIDLLDICDYVLVMSVYPGFSGQPYLDFVGDKIEYLVDIRKKYHYQLIIDGAISCEKISELSKLGVDGFVLGTKALFVKGKTYDEVFKELRSKS